MEEQATNPLYAERKGIFPRSVRGRYRNIKWAILALAYSVYFLLPWLRWDRVVGPDQAVLFDIVHRKFYLFNLVIHPQDIFWLAGFLVIAALTLFFVTGLAGRVFCGYFCFQTLWTDLFIRIEKLVQGERPARIRLAKAPMTRSKFAKLALTHALWLLVAFVTGITFVFYWDNAPDILLQFFTGQAPFSAYATTLFLTAATYVMAGVAREQVCTYMCPYSRFQAVMYDAQTLVVSYDEVRGECTSGRSKLVPGSKQLQERQARGVGDCIDCGYCVQVCPTGIDIRNGLQIQCISCALCIDACDSIMDSLNWPRGLIAYTSESGSKTTLKKLLLRPKVVAYGFVLAAAIALLGWSISNQAPYDVAVSQVRQPLFVRLSDGRIMNSYELKINNKLERELTARFAVVGLESAEIDLGNFDLVTTPAEGRTRLLMRIKVDATRLPNDSSHRFTLRLEPEGPDAPAADEHTVIFYTPETQK